LNHSMLKSNSLERISGELLTRSFSYSALRTYMHIPTKKLLTQYFHFLFQLLQYDPDAKEKLRNLVEIDYAYWRAAIQRAIATGELREDVDVEDAVVMFRQVYMGLSFEMAFMGGLNTQRLAKHLHAVYSLLKR
ncbi:TetR/AcrR family transcriptional regulator C-terminal ligand-binding domain-containing protein, partial [Bacteroides fragilis]